MLLDGTAQRRVAARGRQRPRLRARASPPADAAPETSQSAAGSQSGRTRGGGGRCAGERAGQQPSQPPRHRNPSNSGAGTRAGSQGTCPQNTELQLGIFGVVGTFPRPSLGLTGSGPGGISACPCCAEAAGREQGDLCLSWESRLEGTPKPPSARAWGDALSAVIPIRAVGPRLWECGWHIEHPGLGEMSWSPTSESG